MAAIAVSGCSDVDDYNQVAEAEANKQALDRLNRDTEISRSLLSNLQEQDPTIVDAQYVLDENGQRTMRVARQGEDGQIHTWQAPADEFSQAEAQAEQQAGGGGALTSMLIAGMAGYMFASMFSGAGATQAMSPAAYQQQRQRSAAAYTSSVRQSSLGAAARRAMPASAGSIGRTQGGSFAGAGARSGGYASGG